MKILITTDWYQPVINGVVTSVINMERELRKQGHEVRVLTLSQNAKSYRKKDVTYLGSLSAGKIYPNARIRILFKRKWLKELVEWNPDIVHSQCEFSTFPLAKKIADMLDIPLIHTYHTIYEDYTHYFSPSQKMGRKSAELFSRAICNQTDCVIAPTRKVKKLLEKYMVQVPVKISPSGIDLRVFNTKTAKKQIKKEMRLPEDATVLLYLGRMAKEKNAEELLGYLKDYQGKNLVLLMVGDGPDRGALQQAALEVSPCVQVIFTGMVPAEDTWRYYMAADLFVSASQSETQGLTYVEASAAGLVLLCKKDDCLQEIIHQNRNGWQFETAEEFQTHLQEFVQMDAVQRQQMSVQAKLTAEAFSASNTVKNLISIYTQAQRTKERRYLNEVI